MQMKNIRGMLTSRFFYHAYFWIFFFGLMFLSYGAEKGSYTVRIVHSLEYIAFLIVPVYSHFFVFDRFFYKKKYLRYALFLLTILIGWGYVMNRFLFQRISEKGSLFSAMVSIFFILMITTSFKVVAENVKQRFLLQQIEAKQVQTELRLLKAQINPHFLFNTLNNLFGMARKKDPRTADGIAGLSHLMRYMIYESNVEFISLEKEIQQIDRLIELQKLRFSKEDDIQIDFAIEGELANVRIPPMLLIPFVENAFKHGISLSTPSYVRIHLRVENETLDFSARNSNPSRAKIKREVELGVGLQNVNRRLELIYPGKHELAISDGENEFEVRLVLRTA